MLALAGIRDLLVDVAFLRFPLHRLELVLVDRGRIVKKAADGKFEIHVRSHEYGSTKQVTEMKGMSYDPAWSPTHDLIAFVSTDTGNDEIYTVDPNTREIKQLTFNDWEWDKHPSWSLDGTKLVFWSNRDTARRQIWIMNGDGSEQRNLSNSDYNDWDPVWVK